MNLEKMSNGEKSLLLILNSITSNTLYCTTTPTSNARTVLPWMFGIYAIHMSTPTTEHEGILFYDTFPTEIAGAPTSHTENNSQTFFKFSAVMPFLWMDVH
jgi:hypothetical protein